MANRLAVLSLAVIVPLIHYLKTILLLPCLESYPAETKSAVKVVRLEIGVRD